LRNSKGIDGARDSHRRSFCSGVLGGVSSKQF
jgi:hypothetical protein